MTLKTKRGVFKEEKAIYADPNLFTFFSIPLIYGQPEHVLNEVDYVVLSQSTAIKYFGERDPRGELLKLNDTTTLKVTGVYEDLPHCTHLDFDLVISNVGTTKPSGVTIRTLDQFVTLSSIIRIFKILKN